jgi:hypothetical protein
MMSVGQLFVVYKQIPYQPRVGDALKPAKPGWVAEIIATRTQALDGVDRPIRWLANRPDDRQIAIPRENVGQIIRI